MSEGLPYADLVIFALIAVFILLRLRSVLGQKTGNDLFLKRDQSLSAPESQERVVHVTEKSLKPKAKEEADTYLASLTDTAVIDAITAIKARDAQFNATSFLDGAKAAFEMVFEAFARGDKQTLKMLLSDPLYQHFTGEIDARTGNDQKTEVTLVSIGAREITNAALNKNTARITVRFTSEQISLLRDAQNAIVEGDPSRVHQVIDEWVFERDVTSKNPNWKIIET